MPRRASTQPGNGRTTSLAACRLVPLLSRERLSCASVFAPRTRDRGLPGSVNPARPQARRLGWTRGPYGRRCRGHVTTGERRRADTAFGHVTSMVAGAPRHGLIPGPARPLILMRRGTRNSDCRFRRESTLLIRNPSPGPARRGSPSSCSWSGRRTRRPGRARRACCRTGTRRPSRPASSVGSARRRRRARGRTNASEHARAR